MTASGMGPRRVVLHLGMLKTGSTSIQDVWSGYRDERIEYADLGIPNHSLILQRAVLEGRAADRVFRGIPDDRRAMVAERARDRVGRLLAGTYRSVILSGESLSRFEPDAAARTVALMRRHVEAVEGLIYIRAPESFVRSVFQERLKMGGASFGLADAVPAYRQRAMAWAEALGAEPTYVLFDRSTLQEGDAVADFGHRLGLDPAWARSRAHLQNRNASLSAEATAALYLLRRVRGVPAPGADTRVRHQLLVEALGTFGTRRYDFSVEAMSRALAARSGEIAWIEGRLGRPLPREPVKDPVVWGSEADVLAYAESLAPTLADHLRRTGLAAGHASGSTLDLLESVLERPMATADVARESRQHGSRVGSLMRGIVRRLAPRSR